MHQIHTFQDFLNSKQDSFYGFDGLHNQNISVPPCPIYKLYAKDFFYNEKEKTLTLNIGNYYNKKLDYLLKSLFVPLDELHFDLVNYIKSNNITLTLNNDYQNLNDYFFSTVYSFFQKTGIQPLFTGIWKNCN